MTVGSGSVRESLTLEEKFPVEAVHTEVARVERAEHKREVKRSKNIRSSHPLSTDMTGLDHFRLPGRIKTMYGCGGCDWDGTSMCYYDKVPRNGICLERVQYLKSFVRDDGTKLTVSKFIEDYNEGMGQLQLNDDYKFYLRFRRLYDEKVPAIKSEIDALESDLSSSCLDQDTFKRKRELLKSKLRVLSRFEDEDFKLRKNWLDLWKEMRKYTGSKVERETPKKVQVEHTHMSLNDIHRIMADDVESVVDAEVIEE